MTNCQRQEGILSWICKYSCMVFEVRVWGWFCNMQAPRLSTHQVRGSAHRRMLTRKPPTAGWRPVRLLRGSSTTPNVYGRGRHERSCDEAMQLYVQKSTLAVDARHSPEKHKTCNTSRRRYGIHAGLQTGAVTQCALTEPVALRRCPKR